MSWELKVHNPKREALKNCFIFVLVCLIPVSFWFGTQHPQENIEHSQELESLKTVIEDQTQKIAELQQNIRALETTQEIVRRAEDGSRLTIKSLEEQLFAVKQEYNQYRGSLSATNIPENLSIDNLELIVSENPNHFRYKLFVSRLEKTDKSIYAKINITFKGRLNGKEVSIPIQNVSSELGGKDIEIEFRNIQSYPAGSGFGDIEFPKNFILESTLVRAEVKGRRPVEKILRWNP